MFNEQQQMRFTQLWTDRQQSVSHYVASLIRDPWALGVAKFEVLGYRRDAARDRMTCDSVFLDRYTKVWAEVAPLLSHELEALRHCFSELALRPRTIIKLRYAEGETSESLRHFPISMLSTSR
jgi:RNA polymerase sigma-70 factor, ECF subfamily